MTTKKRQLGPGQIQRLNKRLRDMHAGEEPELAAAELAEHMRRYGLRSWGGVTLTEADARANEAVYFSDVYHGGRHWSRSSEPWTTGERLLVLFTPSVARALVLRDSVTPSWPAVDAHVGLRLLPRHPQKSLITPRLEVHHHALPTTTPVWGMVTERWENCCGRSFVDLYTHERLRILIEKRRSIQHLRHAMLEIWQQVHGPARTAWE